ncbi:MULTISPECIES: hypothetical protein [unclassified Nocardiopsis]|uniref:hypothetical protein n=1 Tax=unclassified Nocardiopsis TaxID=2649073 RepID=UPI001F3358B5|nr:MULTISPECIES: hypothetical protein [unclassified Nocardiopsis]
MQDPVSPPISPATRALTSARNAAAPAASRLLASARGAAPVASRALTSARSAATGLLAARHPGVRPPTDVRQTCVLMFAAAPALGLLAYVAWERAASGLPESYALDLRALAAWAVATGVVLAALAVPVRRGGRVPWRAARCGALVAMGVALIALHQAARLADTRLVLAGFLVAVVAIAVNIALWSTRLRRWCAP